MSSEVNFVNEASGDNLLDASDESPEKKGLTKIKDKEKATNECKMSQKKTLKFHLDALP